MPDRFSPLQIARAYRALNPGKFDEFDDYQLFRALEQIDPQTADLVDPLLKGAEILAPTKGQQALRRQAQQASRHTDQPFPVPWGPLPTPEAPPLPLVPQVAPGVVGGIGGALAGTALGGFPIGTAVGGALGSGGGELGRQTLEMEAGPREDYSLPLIAFEAGLGAINPAAKGTTIPARIASSARQGAVLGGAGAVGRPIIEHGELPSLEQVARESAFGGVLGGGIGGAAEGLGRVGRAVDMGTADSLGALPVDLPPPPGRPDLAVMETALRSQYQQEEARLAQELEAVFKGAPRPANRDFHSALEAKDYLEQIAANRVAMETVGSLRANLETAGETLAGGHYGPLDMPPYIQRAEGLDVSPLQLPPGRGDPNAIRAYPPGVNPNIELVGSMAPDAGRVIGGRDIGGITDQPPPTFEQALEASLQAPPGDPRLVRPLILSSPEGEVPRGMAETGQLLPPPPRPRFDQPIEQGGLMGGRRATETQPRLPQVETPGYDRPYATGPNAGPRQKGELHGQPRTLRRQLTTGKKTSYETFKSTRHAEDPGTYPPEVRRELAAMAWELEQYPHMRAEGAGITDEQLEAMVQSGQAHDRSDAVAQLRKSGATAGGALAGAPVYHKVIAAAEGAFKHVTRSTMRDHLRAALLEGRGTGLTDAAAQVARQRLAYRAAGENPDFYRRKSSGKLAKTPEMMSRGDEGDELIGWVDPETGARTSATDLDEYQTAAREAETSELWSAYQLRQAGSIAEGTEPYFDAAAEELARRGVISREQLGLTMEGPGGDKGPSLFDFEGGPPEKPTPAAEPVTLYRGQVKPGGGKGLPQWVKSDPRYLEVQRDATGRWYTDDPEIAKWYAREAGNGEVVTLQVTPEQAAQARVRGSLAERYSRDPDREFFFAEGPPPKPTGYLTDQPSLPGQLEVRGGRVYPKSGDLIDAEVPLPGLEGVRQTETPTPEIDLPFALTPPPSKPIAPRTGNLFTDLMREEGVLVFNIPAGDRQGLRKWLKAQEPEHGGETWFNRADQAMDEGNWDRAWAAAAAASRASYAKAYRAAKTPAQQAAITAAVKGTVLQEDINTDIIAGARSRAGLNEAPPVKDFPPSRRVTQAGAARGKGTLGPAGILDPGARQRPLSSAAPGLRAATLDREVVKLVMELTDPETISTIPGNTDTYLRLFRQVGEQIYKGENLKLLRDAGVKIPPEELAQHFNATISDAGRTLQLLSSFAQAHREVLTEAAERLSFGGQFVGARARVVSPAAQKITQEMVDEIAERTSRYQATALANDLQKRAEVSPLKAVHDASYSWMLSKWATAVRNYASFAGRYSIDSLDHALTIPLAHLSGDPDTAKLSTALLKERGLQPIGKEGTKVNPLKGGWAEDLQGIYDFTVDGLNSLPAKDARQALKLLLDAPEQAMHYLGTVGGEDVHAQFVDTPVLRHLTNPKVQRFLTMFNRAQEFSARATVFDGTVRALLRAKGLDPAATLVKPTPEIIAAVGGQRAFDDLMFTATAQSLEATFAGRTSKDSIPGFLIRGINEWWGAKLAMPFPRFNLSAAPRFIWDHGPWALVDLVRFPLDNLGWTAKKGSVGGGRLYRGVRAQQIVRDELPALQLQIGQAERRQGESLQQLLTTQREWQVRQRQIARLTKRAQQGLPDVTTTLEAAQEAQAQLARRRDQLKAAIYEQKTVVTDLKAEQSKLLERVTDATGINAPNFAQFLARAGVGTAGMLGAAWVVRAQEGAKGTRWYEYRIDRGEGKDPIIVDFRPFAPFAQYLFVADVLQDFYSQTNWAKVKDDVMTEEEGMVASPLDWSRAMWNNYEGKYTEGELGSQFAQAFLSISRAAGTTLTLTDLATQNGWPSMEDASRAMVGTIGQFLSRFTIPGQQASDLLTAPFSAEEAKVRTPPKATAEDWERPLAGPMANIPFAKQLIPERISQTSGQPVAAEYPLLRGLLGIGTTPRDFVVEEVRRIGVPGSTVYIRETGDVGLDRLVAETYARNLQQYLPQVLESDHYATLATPARQRDFLQRYFFPAVKRGSLGEVRLLLGNDRYTEATVRGENARRKERQARLIEDLAGESGQVIDTAEPEPTEVDPFDALGPPPGPPQAP